MTKFLIRIVAMPLSLCLVMEPAATAVAINCPAISHRPSPSTKRFNEQALELAPLSPLRRILSNEQSYYRLLNRLPDRHDARRFGRALRYSAGLAIAGPALGIGTAVGSGIHQPPFDRNLPLPQASHGYAGTERLTFHPLPHGEAVRRRRELSGITRKGILQAHDLLTFFGIVKKPTSLIENPGLNSFLTTEMGRPLRLFLKDETENPTGSFKDRAPIQLYHRVFIKNPPEGVETVSTGNHGRAATHAVWAVMRINEHLRGRLFARVTMGKGSLEHKKEAIVKEGGIVRDHFPEPDGPEIGSYDAGERIVKEDVAKSKGRIIEIPHADPFVINGYSTSADEFLQQLEEKGIAPSKLHPGQLTQFCSLGSGGFFAGMLEARALYPTIDSYAVGAAPADMAYESLKQGKMIRRDVPSSEDIAVDGNMATPAEFALPLIRELATGALKVRDEDALYGAALLMHFGIEAEATSGLTIAALLLHSDLFEKTEYVVAPLTSRNLGSKGREKLAVLARDLDGIRTYFERRRRSIEVEHEKASRVLPVSAVPAEASWRSRIPEDLPGRSLEEVSQILKDAAANVLRLITASNGKHGSHFDLHDTRAWARLRPLRVADLDVSNVVEVTLRKDWMEADRRMRVEKFMVWSDRIVLGTVHALSALDLSTGLPVLVIALVYRNSQNYWGLSPASQAKINRWRKYALRSFESAARTLGHAVVFAGERYLWQVPDIRMRVHGEPGIADAIRQMHARPAAFYTEQVCDLLFSNGDVVRGPFWVAPPIRQRLLEAA